MINRSGSRILVHGHRGARAVYPENTLVGFQYAIDMGADALEMDVAATTDNVLVISHDPHINPEICTGPHLRAAIHDLMLAEVREHDCGSLKNSQFPRQQTVPGARIPTLEEALILAGHGNFHFDIEIKSFADRPALTPPPEEFAYLVAAEIHRQRLETRVVVQSFDFRVLHSMKRLAPKICLAALWEGAALPFESIGAFAEANIISPEFRLVTPEQVKSAHAHNLLVVPWTANTEDDWQKLIDADVDGIITDDPAALIDYLKETGLRPA